MDQVKEEYTLNDVIESLNDLNSSSVATNNSIKELTEFLSTQQQAEDHEKAVAVEQAQEDSEAKAEEQAVKEEEQKQADQAQAEADQAQAETYESILIDINDGIQLTNQLLTVQGVYIGIVCGLLFIKILLDRLRK